MLSETVADVDFDAFYRAECKSLARFVMFLSCMDADTAEDIAQTAFTRAFPVWPTIRFPQAWLRKVAQNEYLRYCRAAARETSLDADPGRTDCSAGISAAMAVEQQVATREVLAAIADLPPKQWQVMAWHWDRFSDAEIAAELGDAAVAVRKNRNRAMKNLKQSLAHVGREGESSRRPWRVGVPRITEDGVNALVTGARTDIAEILDDVLDNEAGLARIYAAHGQQPHPRAAAAAPDEKGGQVSAVCERIAMLETTLAQAAKPDGPSIRARMYLEMARGFLFELRSGLASRDLSAEDAFRLLSPVRRDLQEADRTLRSEQRLPLPPLVLAGISEMRELTSEMTGQLAVLDEQVMGLFGHSDDPAAVPVPHH